MIDYNDPQQIEMLKKIASTNEGKMLISHFNQDLPKYEDIPEDLNDIETGQIFRATRELRKFIDNKTNLLNRRD